MPRLHTVATCSDLEAAVDAMSMLAKSNLQDAEASEGHLASIFTESANRWKAAAERLQRILDERWERGEEVIR